MPKNVFLNLSPFLLGKTQFTESEAMFTRKLAGCHILVERAIERIKIYKILSIVTVNLRPFCDKIVQISAVLANLQSPIIEGVFDQ